GSSCGHARRRCIGKGDAHPTAGAATLQERAAWVGGRDASAGTAMASGGNASSVGTQPFRAAAGDNNIDSLSRRQKFNREDVCSAGIVRSFRSLSSTAHAGRGAPESSDARRHTCHASALTQAGGTTEEIAISCWLLALGSWLLAILFMAVDVKRAF